MGYIGKTFCRRGLEVKIIDCDYCNSALVEVVLIKPEYKGIRRMGDKFIITFQMAKDELSAIDN